MSEPRIRPPAKYNDLLEKLVKEENIFETNAAVLLFAAALGYQQSSRRSVENYGVGIRWDIFSRREDDHFINLLALAEKQNVDVLDDNQDAGHHVAIFEEYVACGLALLEEHYINKTGDLLDKLLALIIQSQSVDAPLNGGLEGLSPAVLDTLVGGF